MASEAKILQPIARVASVYYERHAIVLNWPSEYYLMLGGNDRRPKGSDSFSGELDNILPGL